MRPAALPRCGSLHNTQCVYANYRTQEEQFMKGDHGKRLMLDVKEAKERKHAAYLGGIGSWRLKGNTYRIGV